MARFLSPEWMAEVEEAANRSDRLREAATKVDLTVRQVVRGAPEGDISYTVRLSGGTVTVTAGGGDGDGDLEVTQDHATAVAISRGELSPAAAFADGRLKLGGRVGLLVRLGDTFAGLGDAFASVRGSTVY
jgi:putative sterol carrier protein